MTVKTLCQIFRKPAGTEPQTGWIAPKPNPRNLTAPRFARSVQNIPAICKKRLNIASYGENIFTSVGRHVTAASLSRSRLREFKTHKHVVDNHNDPESFPEISKTFNIMIPTHIREMLGVSKVALSYFFRDDLT